MKTVQKSRSGKAFFLTAVFLVFAAILGTVLLANGQRNLSRLLAYFHIPVTSESLRAQPQRVRIRHSKGVRLPPARMALPVYAFAHMRAPEQHFTRAIRSDPRTLCEQLKSAGFGGMDWSASSGNKENWECSSLTTLPSKEAGDVPQSSVFVFIKGDAENRVTSFRVKLNIETPADSRKDRGACRHGGLDLSPSGPLGERRRDHRPHSARWRNSTSAPSAAVSS